MPLPKPLPGLVLPYRYLWHREREKGSQEGRKARPCVVVVAVSADETGATTVVVAPVTHQPAPNLAAVEIPQTIKKSLGLDAAPSWIILTELNEFEWPGPDVEPIPGTSDQFAYGFLPDGLFRSVTSGICRVWSQKRGQVVRRTD